MANKIRVELPLRRESPRRARLALEPLRASIDPDSFAEICLVVSELVSDAVLAGHADGAGRVELSARAESDRILIAVRAGAAAFEPLPSGPKPEDRGWGIYLLRRLGYRWEVDREEGSAQVLAEKELDGD
jgi:anti-sigma regulatory factor (Ser/Thr protein kinase)